MKIKRIEFLHEIFLHEITDIENESVDVGIEDEDGNTYTMESVLLMRACHSPFAALRILRKQNPRKQNPRKQNPRKQNPRKQNPRKQNPRKLLSRVIIP